MGSNERKCFRDGLGTKKMASCQRHSRWVFVSDGKDSFLSLGNSTKELETVNSNIGSLGLVFTGSLHIGWVAASCVIFRGKHIKKKPPLL